mgnify:CR=1 FL=1
MVFQSTLPARGATIFCIFSINSMIFQSTLPARGATLVFIHATPVLPISIHTPREGSDPHGCFSCIRIIYFNPHSPRGERLRFNRLPRDGKSFQSTLPARGATSLRRNCLDLLQISIHTPREGSDFRRNICRLNLLYFNPHSPRGERRYADCFRLLNWRISIHTPREGSDIERLPLEVYQCYFNPHSPRGERRHTLQALHNFLQFQSTLPARGATSSR